MSREILVTNNTDFLADDCGFDVRFVDTLEYTDVLKAARDLIHKGHVMKTHPLSGSVKPFETPYKSIVLSPKAQKDHAGGIILDKDSLVLIEDARIMAEKFRRHREFTEKLLADFRLIDRDLIEKGK